MTEKDLKLSRLRKILITFLTILLISISCLLIVSALDGNNLEKNNTSMLNANVSSEQEGIEISNKYRSTLSTFYNYQILRMFRKENYPLKLDDEVEVTSVPSNATHYCQMTPEMYMWFGPVNSDDNKFEYNNPTYEISNDEEFAEFMDSLKIRHKVERYTMIYKQDWGGRITPWALTSHTDYYPTYPFSYKQSEQFDYNLCYVKYRGTYYMGLGMYPDPPKNGKAFEDVDEVKVIEIPIEADEGVKRIQVVLTNNVSYKLQNVEKNDPHPVYFCGIFDGNGHTIKFTGKYMWHYNQRKDVGELQEATSPFIEYLDQGIIRNVRLDYSSVENVTIDDGGAGKSYFGGIVGNNNGGDIYNCIVHSPKIRSIRHNQYAYYAALVAINFGIVSNCAVTGEYKISTTNDTAGVNAYWGAIPFQKSNNKENSPVTSCVFSASVNEVRIGNKDLMRTPADLNSTTDSNKTQLKYSPDGDHRQSYDVFDGGTWQHPISYPDVSPSAVGGKRKSIESPDYWYYAPDYNGYPLLRDFVNWKDVNFESSDDNAGTINGPKTIKVPKDANSFEKYECSTLVIKVYNQSSSIEIKDTNKHLRDWQYSNKSGTDTFTAYFVTDTMEIIFKQDSPTDGNVYCEGSPLGKDGLKYTVAKGSIITFKVEPCGDSLRTQKKDGFIFYIYNSIRIEFSKYNANGTTSDMVIVLDVKSAGQKLEVLGSRNKLENYKLPNTTQTRQTFSFVTLKKFYDITIL